VVTPLPSTLKEALHDGARLATHAPTSSPNRVCIWTALHCESFWHSAVAYSVHADPGLTMRGNYGVSHARYVSTVCVSNGLAESRPIAGHGRRVAAAASEGSTEVEIEEERRRGTRLEQNVDG
jgi:hypothetical protein